MTETATPRPAGDDPQREASRIAGQFAQHLCDDWLYALTGEAVDLAGARFTVMYPEDSAPLFGWDADDDTAPTVLRRESDGAYFQVDVEVMATRISPEKENHDA